MHRSSHARTAALVALALLSAASTASSQTRLFTATPLAWSPPTERCRASRDDATVQPACIPVAPHLVEATAAPQRATLSFGATLATTFLGFAAAGLTATATGLLAESALPSTTTGRAQWRSWSIVGGAALGFPLGVVATSWMRGRQTPLGWTLLGSVVGAAPGLVAAALTAQQREYDDNAYTAPWGATVRDANPSWHASRAFKTSLALAALGGIAGTFVAWHFAGGNQPRRSTVTATPVVSASLEGATVGLAGTF
jgi:hypothetical protein